MIEERVYQALERMSEFYDDEDLGDYAYQPGIETDREFGKAILFLDGQTRWNNYVNPYQKPDIYKMMKLYQDTLK